MDICKINTQIERLEQELAKLKEEATAPSQYELEYECGDAFYIGSYIISEKITRFIDSCLNTGRYRSTHKFANEHFQTQNEMMRLGALIEAVTIELGMVSWTEDWNDDKQTKYYVYYAYKDNKYYLECWRTFRTTGVIYMPEAVAIRVCKILNNNEYEL